MNDAHIQFAEATGKSYLTLQSTWWGNKALGAWVDEIFADIEHTTKDDDGNDKAYRLTNVVRGSAAEEVSDPEHVPPNFLLNDAWIPASVVTGRIDREGPANFRVFHPDGSIEPCVRKAFDAKIDDTTEVHTKWGVYTKYAIHLPYKKGESPKAALEEYLGGNNAAWDKWHFTAKYEGDNFVCWIADTDDIEGLVQDLVNALDYPVAVHEKLLPESLIEAAQ